MKFVLLCFVLCLVLFFLSKPGAYAKAMGLAHLFIVYAL